MDKYAREILRVIKENKTGEVYSAIQKANEIPFNELAKLFRKTHPAQINKAVITLVQYGLVANIMREGSEMFADVVEVPEFMEVRKLFTQQLIMQETAQELKERRLALIDVVSRSYERDDI